MASTVTVTPTWQAAMQRALRDHLKATRQVDGTYRVPSVSQPGKWHIVSLDKAGHIIDCSDCKGWENGGRERPCKHAGAVALGRAYETGAHLVIARRRVENLPVQTRTTRSQLYRSEGAA